MICEKIQKNIFLFRFLQKLFIFATLLEKHVFVPWCNGNTLDFGSSIQGSSPCGTTKAKCKPLIVTQSGVLFFIW